jgi:ribosomal protein L11 methylase PrmA
VLPPGVAQYRAAKESGFLDLAMRDGRLIQGREVDPGVLREEAPDAVHVIEHPRLDFISYPYEWSFYGLQAAALLTLDLHLEALTRGLTLSDASAYNIQFVGPRPLFIDYLSLIRYEPGQVWFGYRQFCEQFLNPLLLTALTGVAFQPLYRGTLEGLPSGDLAALLPFRSKLDPRIALHVSLQGRLQRGVTVRRTAIARNLRLSLAGLTNNLRAMRGWVAKLKPKASQRTPWESYQRTAQYTPDERAAKSRVIAEVVAAAAPATVWDLGCNSGEYAELALAHGARGVIGFEPDPGALNAAYQRAVARQLAFLPLAVDLANPSPALGWQQRERSGLSDRCNADLVLCLALLHHLVLGRNLPLSQVLDWLLALAPRGVIEFVPKEDPMAQQLLALKPDIAPEYERKTVTAMLAARARIEREEVVTASGRTLFAFSRV